MLKMDQSLEDGGNWMSDLGSGFIEEEEEVQPRNSQMTASLSDSQEKAPPVQAHTLREFEEHLNDLKKENFSLKLRIYFLEERIQQKYDDSSEDVYKRNIELKVEVESLKRELRDKQQFLDKSWAAAEDLSNHNEAELRRQYEERQQETEHVQELLENKIQLLQEETRLAKNEAERMAAVAETEKKSCLELTRKLKEFTAEMTEARILQKQYCATLADKDKMLQQLTQVLDSKDSLIQQLSAEKQNQQDERVKSLAETVQELTVSLQHKDSELKNLIDKQHPPVNQCDVSAERCVSESQMAEFQVRVLQEKMQEMEAANKMLQEKLHEMSSELKSANEALQKHHCTIQSLNDTLQSKKIEAEEHNQIIGEQNESIVKLQEMLHQSQLKHLPIPVGLPPTQPQVELLDLQNTLFCTQLEMQKVQRAVRKKERQLSDAKRSQQLLEAELREAEQQKETTWTHNQELHITLHQLQTKMQERSQQLQTVEDQKGAVIQEQEQTIQRLNQTLLQKEQLLQEYLYLLQYQETSAKGPGIHDPMLEKLQQRIRDRDKALERAVDEKFCALEEKESERRQLQLAMRGKEHDLERLRSVLSSNEETINSLDSLMKSKDLEIEQTSTAYRNLQWLKQETEEKYSSILKEREGFIQQLQTSLHDRHKELEDLIANCLSKSNWGNYEIMEKLQLCLEHKEKMLQDILNDRNQQAADHEKEIQELLKSVSTRNPQTKIACDKKTHAMEGVSCECKHGQLFKKVSIMVDIPEINDTPSLNQTDELSHLRALLEEKEQIITELMERGSDHSKMMVIVKNNDRKSKEGNRDVQIALEKELANTKEEFQLVSRKERETRLELSALQSLVDKQNEDLQVQAADVESLTRNVQIKEELIKDLQVQLVNPEEVPAVESLTLEVLKLREKVATMELRGQEDFGNRSQELVLMLERLVAERARLNDALQSERQVYSNLVKFHTQPNSCEEYKTLQLELEAVRVLRGHLEKALGQSFQQLSSREAENRAPIDFGGGDRASLRVPHKHAF